METPSGWRAEYERWERGIREGTIKKRPYSQGSDEEPLWRKLRRQSWLTAAPKWVPPTWVEAARSWLDFFPENVKHLPEVERILRDDRLKPLWTRLDELLQLQHATPTFRNGLIGLLVLRGGRLPPEPLGKKRDRREKIAKKLREALALIVEDEDLSVVNADDLINLVATEAPFSVSRGQAEVARSILRRLDKAGLPHYSREGPHLPVILAALAEQLEEFEPVWSFDRVVDTPWTPQPGRSTAQRALLERRLEKEFLSATDEPCHDLIALCVEAVFDECQTPEEVARRLSNKNK